MGKEGLKPQNWIYAINRNVTRMANTLKNTLCPWLAYLVFISLLGFKYL